MGLYGALDQGVASGVVAAFVGLVPILVALGGAFFNERVGARQWLSLGLATAGIALLIADQIGMGSGTWLGYQALAFALMGITAGTLYQKRFGSQIDWRTGGFIQLTAAVAIMVPLAYAYEGLQVELSLGLGLSSVWVAIVNVVGAVGLLFVLGQNNRNKAATYSYLVPVATAVMGGLALGETFSWVAVLGFALSAAAVFLHSSKA